MKEQRRHNDFPEGIIIRRFDSAPDQLADLMAAA
jgi:hypothetical protein